jgi:hypothetical protein
MKNKIAFKNSIAQKQAKLKIGNRSKYTVLKRRHTNGQEVKRKIVQQH